jgi:hypothetical protein
MIMIYCKQLNREFETKELLFKALKANEEKIISLKKTKIYESANKGQISFIGAYLKQDIATKAGLVVKDGFVYPVINTTNYMDSHDDVHFPGIWKKTLLEQQGKIFYLSSHMRDIDNVIAWPENVKAFTSLIDWQFVGKNFPGKTEALIFEIAQKDIIKQSALDAIQERRKVQGSVSMKYVTIKLAVDSVSKEYKVNKEYFDKRINDIANKEKVIEQGYFFGVEEAKIANEGSLVLQGSNDATEIIYPEQIKDQPEFSTDKKIDQPSIDTDKAKEIINEQFKNLISWMKKN